MDIKPTELIYMIISGIIFIIFCVLFVGFIYDGLQKKLVDISLQVENTFVVGFSIGILYCVLAVLLEPLHSADWFKYLYFIVPILGLILFSKKQFTEPKKLIMPMIFSLIMNGIIGCLGLLFLFIALILF